MALTLEWRDRINLWREELKKHFYRPLGTVELQGFVTREQLSPEAALRRKFQRMPAGTAWGAKWEYAWFRCRIVLPQSAANERIVFRGISHSESLVLVNGRASGALSWGRSEITLTPSGRPGERFEILAETYAGHGPTPCNWGPVPPERPASIDVPAAQQAVLETSYGIWDEAAYQLWIDMETLWSLRENCEAGSLRVAEIDAGLQDFTALVDFELPLAERRITFLAGRKRLKPLLQCRNGSTAPVLFGFGHGHLDVAWLWPLAETERKAGRTFSSQLELMQEYPGYKFLQSEPHVYWMAKQRYPELYARMRKAVKSGQLVAEGSMWVEPDMNIASGEALIRQCLHGKRFFKREFGIDNELLWLPDVFGYSAALPQILRGCGVKYFATAKIFWNYHGGENFPHNTFTWEGIDGSTVLAHLFNNYEGPGNPEAAISRWNTRPQKDGLATMVFCFGHGDGGGGPTREHVESVLRLRDLEGCPRVKLAGPLEFFKDLEGRGTPSVRYVGELYFQAHRGTYTTQARTKRGNRKSELALRETEMWSAAAQALARFKYPTPAMETLWRKVLLNQFHDILPGSSIGRVYEEAEAAYAEVLADAGRVTTAAKRALTAGKSGLTVFNSLNWERRALVELPDGWTAAQDSAGNPLPVQRIGRRPCAEVSAPACGWTTLQPTAESQPAISDGVRADEQAIENECLRVRFNRRGEITGIFDKESRREFAAGLCNSFKMYKDLPGQWEAWDLDSLYPLTPVPLGEPATIKVLARGPLVGQLKITRPLNNSLMTQIVSLARGSRRLDFHTTIQWQECHRLLKVAFPVAIYADHALHEIQFGHVRRPNHQSRQYDADRFEVANQKWSALAEENGGFAVLNDCKYGVNVLGNSINLTLLRATKAPDQNADQGRQEFAYAFYCWNGGLADSNVVREAYELNCPVSVAPGAAGERSLLSLDAGNIVIEAVKPAEDGSGDTIVRLWESKRAATRCVLTVSLPVQRATLTDMLENDGEPLKMRDKRIALTFRPFEIKTIRLSAK
jgi:alpha-mannosidase